MRSDKQELAATDARISELHAMIEALEQQHRNLAQRVDDLVIKKKTLDREQVDLSTMLEATNHTLTTDEPCHACGEEARGFTGPLSTLGMAPPECGVSRSSSSSNGALEPTAAAAPAKQRASQKRKAHEVYHCDEQVSAGCSLSRASSEGSVDEGIFEASVEDAKHLAADEDLYTPSFLNVPFRMKLIEKHKERSTARRGVPGQECLTMLVSQTPTRSRGYNGFCMFTEEWSRRTYSVVLQFLSYEAGDTATAEALLSAMIDRLSTDKPGTIAVHLAEKPLPGLQKAWNDLHFHGLPGNSELLRHVRARADSICRPRPPANAPARESMPCANGGRRSMRGTAL